MCGSVRRPTAFAKGCRPRRAGQCCAPAGRRDDTVSPSDPSPVARSVRSGAEVDGCKPLRGVRSRREFAALRRQARTARSGPVSVSFAAGLPAGGIGDRAAAYAVGRKVGGAVVRNRLKRQLRAIMAVEAAQLPPGMFLVRVAPDAASLDFSRLRSCVAGAAARAALPDMDGRRSR